jgi:hypothetical protein
MFGYSSSQSISVVPGDQYQLVILSLIVIPSVTVCAAATETGPPRFTVILDSVGTFCGYGDGSATLHATMGWTILICSFT